MILDDSFSSQPSDQYWKQPWRPNFFLVLFPRDEGSLIFFFFFSDRSMIFVIHVTWLVSQAPILWKLLHRATSTSAESYGINAPLPLLAWGPHQRQVMPNVLVSYPQAICIFTLRKEEAGTPAVLGAEWFICHPWRNSHIRDGILW